MLDRLIEEAVQEFKKDPRNKIHVEFPVLLESAKEETGKNIQDQEMIAVIGRYLKGQLEEDSEEIYDGAVYACSVIARKLWADDPDDEDADVDYSIDWLENADGTFCAVVRPV